MSFHSYEPRAGHGLPHDPLNAIVAPRPIGWVSTVSESGAVNLAPYSFFNLLNYRPPIVAFASIGWKDSVANASAVGEFVWNLATVDLAEPMNATSATGAADVDEMGLAGLTPLPAERVRPPRVAESPVGFECRVADVHRLRTADGEDVDTWLVVGEVVMVHIRETCLRDGVFDTAAVRPLLRGGGSGDYFWPTPEAHLFLRRPR